MNIIQVVTSRNEEDNFFCATIINKWVILKVKYISGFRNIYIFKASSWTRHEMFNATSWREIGLTERNWSKLPYLWSGIPRKRKLTKWCWTLKSMMLYHIILHHVSHLRCFPGMNIFSSERLPLWFFIPLKFQENWPRTFFVVFFWVLVSLGFWQDVNGKSLPRGEMVWNKVSGSFLFVGVVYGLNTTLEMASWNCSTGR